MSDPYLAEIRIFGFNFAPFGWATCNGQILPISQNTALFSLIGTYYGGNGTSNFALPDLGGRVPIDQGQGLGLSQYVVGESGGTPNVTLLTTEVPPHSHNANADSALADSPSVTNNLYKKGEHPGSPAEVISSYNPQYPPMVALNPQTVSMVGSGGPHNNMMPYMALNFCIALRGVFPPRS